MKRIFFSLFILGAFACSYAHTDFSGTVQQFMAERSTLQHLSRAGLSVYNPVFAPSRMVNGVEMVDAFIEVADNGVIEELKKRGVIINSTFDGFVTSQIPVNLLETVSSMTGVSNVEISKLMEFCTDRTLSVTHADRVINGMDNGLLQSYDGSGVIVGIIDAGFDYQHYAFRNPISNTSRISRVYVLPTWEQTVCRVLFSWGNKSTR